jgi:PAS domain S-box-containing protein
MGCPSHAIEPQTLYKLSWVYAQFGKLAIDIDTGMLVDVNPATETLTGYSCAELLGMDVTMLFPEPERKQVQDELQRPGQSSYHSGFHIQRKDGRCLPVMISSSESFELAGRSLRICEFQDITSPGACSGPYIRRPPEGCL